jgi:hypothetical protein
MFLKAIHGLSIAVLCVFVGLPTPAFSGSPADKATGDVLGAPAAHPLWWRYFEFSAHEKGIGPSGKGELTHYRLNADATEIIREELCEILYVSVEGNSAWFAGPIIYDSANVLPLRWIVVHVVDGGQPGAGHDALWWTRVANEAEALYMVEEKMTPAADLVVQAGNLKVHDR